MLNAGVYRAGWLPVLFAVVLVAFSLGEQPAGRGTSLSAQAFDGSAAALAAQQLAATAGRRALRPGSRADDAVAAQVAGSLASSGFGVRRVRQTVRTAHGDRTVTTVLARRTGFSNQQLVIVADRTGGPPGAAGLASTGALLQLGEVLGGRTLGRTLVLASVSGGPGGGGVQALLGELGGPVDALIVVGDLSAGAGHRPWVVPWGSGARAAPLVLRRTVSDALRLEAGAPPGAEGFLGQAVRLAFPLTLGAQAPAVAAGVPAVLVSPHGERPAPARGALDAALVDRFGRGVLRAATALDAGAPVPAPAPELVLDGKVVPPWAVRLLIAVLLLPPLLGVVDGLARVRRRRGAAGMWLRWALCGALPFVACALLIRLLGATGVLPATPTALDPAVAGIHAGGRLAFALAPVAFVVAGWLGLRPPALRAAGVHGKPAESPGAAAGALALLLAVAVALWALNPLAAALLVPACHLWLFAVAPEVRPSRRAALALVVAGLLPAALVGAAYASAFGEGPLDLAATLASAVTGGALGIGTVVLWSVALGALGSVLAIAVRAEAVPATESVTVRGPTTYAGPGSLGGTESALRR